MYCANGSIKRVTSPTVGGTKPSRVKSELRSQAKIVVSFDSRSTGIDGNFAVVNIYVYLNSYFSVIFDRRKGFMLLRWDIY